MNEIKFMAWDKEKKQWITRAPFWIIGEVTVFDMLKQYSIEDYNNIEIVQFTGMNCIGIDLYSGFIIEILDSQGQPIRHLIEYNEKKGAYNCNQQWLDDLCFTIVGNKYQNPELIPSYPKPSGP